MSPRTSGRLAGALFLAAFLFYGIGTALADQPVGIALIFLNSAAVAVIGVLFFLALRRTAPRTARTYQTARMSEAFLLAAGAWFLLQDQPETNAVLYAVAMVVLAAGSIPMLLGLSRLGWTPTWFAWWGAAGYALLAAGTALDFAVSGAGIALAVPGGLFELAFGLWLLIKGFPAAAAAPLVPEPPVRPEATG
ncbi:DUF4386 family protein [Glycomyces harbinensis]|uniref:DUF4386 domain-containing protein n=1 Tax=Glycomyces harbinensis TaxID=58114 RepID=A0A1G7B2X5_9ACTN|nr:DUF4386 family protein [Glycomyces harbinensis]SDE21371.1 protein of unknown function [Glycomyces harbinensis]